MVLMETFLSTSGCFDLSVVAALDGLDITFRFKIMSVLRELLRGAPEPFFLGGVAPGGKEEAASRTR